MWWPYADYHELETVTFFMLWVGNPFGQFLCYFFLFICFQLQFRKLTEKITISVVYVGRRYVRVLMDTPEPISHAENLQWITFLHSCLNVLCVNTFSLSGMFGSLAKGGGGLLPCRAAAELDLASGRFYRDYDGAQTYRLESLQFIRQALAVEEGPNPDDAGTADADQHRLPPLDEYPPPSPYPTTENFRHVAERFRKGYSIGKRASRFLCDRRFLLLYMSVLRRLE
jgi:hypothetical protein